MTGLIFDWDGVIIDSAAQHEESWVRLAAEERDRILAVLKLAEDAGAIGLWRRCATEYRAQHAAEIQSVVVALQGADQGFRALRLRGVATQCTQQQRQCGAACRGRFQAAWSSNCAVCIPQVAHCSSSL